MASPLNQNQHPHPHPRLETGIPPLHGDSPSPSPRSASISLQAAATMNAGLQREPTRQASNGSLSRSRNSSIASRRRSLVLMNVHANDPAVPAPGEMLPGASGPTSQSPTPILSPPPVRDRQPSLGELHQELEAEQEAHVNRLLAQIREQQLQLQLLQASQGQNNTSQSAIDDSSSTPGAGNGNTPPISGQHPTGISNTSMPRSPIYGRHPRSSFDIARTDLQQRRSRTPSRGASPRLRTGSFAAEGSEILTGRDEVALYQAETQMLQRENQMLRHRIRELENQVSEMHTNSTITHEPPTPSRLLASHSALEEEDSKNA